MSRSFTDNIINSFNVSNYYTAPDQRSEILKWLSPLEPRIRHQDIRTRRAESVGEWLLRTDEFQRWCKGAGQEGSEHTTLFCCGGPAVSKTYFSSLVVDRLCDMAKEDNIAVTCFYVDFAAREEQTPTNMLGSLLKQIVGGLERIPDEISRTFQDYKKVIGGRGLRVPEIVKMMQTVTSLQPTFICVDALDECVDRHRPEVLDSLRQILEGSQNTRIFLTGRRHIQAEIERHLGRGAAVLSMKPSNDDIVGYIRMRLSKDSSLDAMDSNLEAEVIKVIAKDVPETFLLISLTIDAILGETTAYGRRHRLRAMTDGLDLGDIYGATLERIKEQGGEKARLGMAALMWISHSERLLQLDELLHALAVEIGSTDLNSQRIPSVETLLSCCLGLVVIDREASIVRLIHYTLQEYLHTCPDIFGVTHSIMAGTCLTYLNFRTIKEISPTLFTPPQSTPFLGYSSLNWGHHAKKDASAEVRSLALKMFGQIESHISTKLLLLDTVSRTGRYNRDIPTDGHLTGFTGLHCASLFGIVEIVGAVMDQQNSDFNKRDFLGITPLIWAAICGQEEVAQLLLERQIIIPDKPDKYFCRTALSWAAWKGHEGVVRTLLGRATTNNEGMGGWWSGASRAMTIVLGKRHVNPNWTDKYGQTAVSLASEEGHSGVVKLLLGRNDVKPDLADGYGRTPLLLASSKGQEAVVRLLVEQEDVNIDRPDKHGETPLLSAAGSGHEGVVGILLGRKEAGSDMVGKYCQRLLLLAANNGHDGVVKLLLRRGDVNPNMLDDNGSTPLSLAAMSGHSEVVKQLLGRADVDPNMPGNDGRTPLWLAAFHRRDGVVKLLLGQEDASSGIMGTDPQWLFSLAAASGLDGAVKLLLGREDVSPDMPDSDGQTPLSLAAMNGHNGVVKLLLGREGVNPNTQDNDGRTPLWWASAQVHHGAVGLMLGCEDVDPNLPDNSSRTPLLLAARNGRYGVVKLLLRRGDVNPNMPDNDRQTPLWWAARNGYNEVVSLLLGRGDVNPDMPNKDGHTPFSVASEKGHKQVVRLLQARKSASSNAV